MSAAAVARPSVGRRTALVLVSHSEALARGTADVAAQMAPETTIEIAGGRAGGGLGTDFDQVGDAVSRGLEAVSGRSGGGVVVLADLGSAVLTFDAVVELLPDEDRERVRRADAPFVEGAVAAAVTANADAGIDAVVRSALGARRGVVDDGSGSGRVSAASAGPGADTAAAPPDGQDVVRRTVTVTNPLGLHARPAAELARTASTFEADVTVGGARASSVLELMGLGATGGQEIEVVAAGLQAAEAVEAVANAIAGGFGEA